LARRFSDIGFSLRATKGTANYLSSLGLRVQSIGKLDEEGETVIDLIQKGMIQMAINTTDKNRNQDSEDGFLIRRYAVEHGVPLFTSLDTADAILKVMESRAFATNSI
jgi:carbamoyl-phosphate synthase large subunit